jgi:hypothetical protein
MKGPIMAKDKGKKKDEKVTSKKGGDGFAKPSEAKGGGGWKLADDSNVGLLLCMTPLRKEKVTTEDYGEKDVIVADIVVIDEKKPAKSEEHEEVFVFGAWLQGSLREHIGTDQRVLGRLVKSTEGKDGKSGKGYVWKFEDADDDDVDKAREYYASLNPFGKKGGDEKSAKGKKGKPAPEPEKKSKKSKAEPEPKKGKGKKKK